MANETELANIIGPTDVISDGITPALVSRVVALPLIYTEALPMGTNVKKFRKEGSLTAEAIAESAAYTFSASSEYTETSVTATATKFGVISKITLEANKFRNLTPERLIMKQAEAIARDLDDEVLALFSGFSTQVTATSTLTVDDILQAVYLVQSGTSGVSGRRLRGIFDFKGINEIRKEIIGSTAVAWSHSEMVGILAGLQEPNGYVGSLAGVDLFQTSGLPLATADDVALVFDPELAFASMIGDSVDTYVSPMKGSEGGYWEVASYQFYDVVEWNDAAGVGVLSDS